MIHLYFNSSAVACRRESLPSSRNPDEVTCKRCLKTSWFKVVSARGN